MLSVNDKRGVLLRKAQSLRPSNLVCLKLGEFSKSCFDILDKGDELGSGEHVEFLDEPSVGGGCNGIGGETGNARGTGGRGGAGRCHKTWEARQGSLTLGGRLRGGGSNGFGCGTLVAHGGRGKAPKRREGN